MSQFIEMFDNKKQAEKQGVLADFCTLKAGKSVNSGDISESYEEGLYPCYGGNGLRGYVSSYSHDGIYNIIGRQGALCGNVNIVNGKFYATEHAVVVTPKEQIAPHWLYFALSEMNLNQYARGVAQPGLAVNQLEQLPFAIPSMELQKQFVSIALQADKSGFDGLKSQFIEMFGDPMVNNKQWPDYSGISEVTQIVLGSTPNSKEPSYWDGDIRWITPAEMTDQSYYIYDTVRHLTAKGRDAANLTMLPEGTVLFSTRAPIGKVAIVGKEMCCNQGFKNFICSEKLNNVFLYYTLKLKKDYLCSLGTGTTFKELSKRTVESLKIAVPPIELQNQFETIYNQADKSGSVLLYRIAC